MLSLINIITLIEPSEFDTDYLTGREGHWDQSAGLRDEDGRADGLVTRGQLGDHQPLGGRGVLCPQGAEDGLRVPDHGEQGAVITGNQGDIPIGLTQ